MATRFDFFRPPDAAVTELDDQRVVVIDKDGSEWGNSRSTVAVSKDLRRHPASINRLRKSIRMFTSHRNPMCIVFKSVVKCDNTDGAPAAGDYAVLAVDSSGKHTK